MKRIAAGLIYSLVGVLLMTSCKKDDEVVKSSEVALLSFGIKGLRKVGNTVMSGSSVSFTIDQTNRIVENKDSIMFGVDITRVLVSVTADGNVCYLNSAGNLFSIEDSIDFTNPVTFRVISYDEQFTRDYTAKINVHRVDTKKTAWRQQESVGFPTLTEQKSFVKGNRLYVVGIDADGVYRTSSSTLGNSFDWTTTECTGVEGAGLSVLFMDNKFYLNTNAGLYCSDDATTWVAVTDETSVDALPESGIGRDVAWFCQPLKTNADIKRSIFIATAEETDTYAQVWTKLSTEEEWGRVVPQTDNVYGCPNLKSLAVIQYAGNMYAMGGKKDGNGDVRLATFESRDNGLTWKQNDATFSLPQEVIGENNCSFSAATDGEYVWLMWSNGEIWRGRWNGLGS